MKISSICPKELRKGDPIDYLKEIIEMLRAYREGRYVDITNEKL